MRSKKETILHAAEQLFRRKGYKNTSIAEIAQKAGLSVGTLYAYFSGKEKLFQAVNHPELKKFDPCSEKRKSVIVKTALNTFAEKGFSATTMDEIAELCGFSKTVLYRYFAGKEELFAAIFYDADLLAKYQEIPFETSKTNLRDYLKDTGTFFLRLFDDPDRLSLMRVVLSESSSLSRSGKIMYQNTIDKVTEKVSRRLALYADAGILVTADFKLAARSFLGMLYSFVLTDRILYPSASRFSDKQIVDFAVGLFVSGLDKGM